MKQLALLSLLIVIGLIYSCCSDDDDKTTVVPVGNKSINLNITSRVGAVINDDLTNYIQSLNLLVFRKNQQDSYILWQNKLLTLNDLESLENSSEPTTSGYTTQKSVIIDKLPVGTYEIVGLANALDDTGNALPGVSLSGVITGNTQEQVITSVTEGMTSPRFFWGITSPVVLGATNTVTPTLTLNRKVAMFMLTIKNVPQVVNKISLESQNTYGAFDMTGKFLTSNVINVNKSSTFNSTEIQDSVLITSVSLPSAGSSPSTFIVTFTLKNGQEITSVLPQYTLQENTITMVTATVNTENPGEEWNLNLTLDVEVNVEWNVDQEPPIEI